MADKGFNGSTFSFGSAVAAVTGISHKSSAGKVKITTPEDAKQLHVAGTPEETVSVNIRGGTSLAVGDVGVASIAFNDGTSISLGNCQIFDVSTDGTEESGIDSTIELGPTTPVA